MSEPRHKNFGLLAEFDGPESLMHAAEKFRDEKYQKFDCHSPYPIHGMDQAMGLKRSPVGYIAGILGFIGGSGGLLLQWWTSTVDYPIVISGKPLFSYQAYVPVTFGLTVLLAALGAFFGMLIANRLPQLYHAVFHSERFTRVTDDGFFLSVEASDPRYDEDKTRQMLESVGGINIEVLRAE